MESTGHSVFAIGVPGLESWVRERTRHYDASFLGIDDAFFNAHITLLGPWMAQPTAAALNVVAAIAARTPAFDFELHDFGVFPDGIVYLAPTPPSPFRALTLALTEAFPDFPPYGGAFDLVVPHLTLDRASTEVSEASVRGAIGTLIPLRSRASRIDLQWWANDRCHVMASWPLVGEVG